MGEEVIKKPKEEANPPTGDEAKDKSPEPPSPPPQEVVLRVFMHCEGCARKVRRCLKGFEGVEDVTTDCKTHKVVVKGENADPLKVLERLQKKSSRKVELLSPVPKPAAEEPKQPEKEEPPKQEEKKNEPVPEPEPITVVLKVHMHCEACAQEIRKRILKMKGVESVVPDLKNSQVAVKGIFPEAELVDYVHKRTGKHAVIISQEPGKPEDNKKVEKKTDEGGEKKADEGGEPAQVADDMPMDMRKNEYYYYQPANFHLYPSRNASEAGYAYPPAPQMFSDENPNACSVM
ncbi:heavy metal-associated isoprenylated plant protein 7-like isoform X2 [Bidens hawaiensis]|uniref:heavy metal-associated isoprenylated plant protein 7-like isoform X2 n=1 Tax=Bidens hawaiensis TaxID=980011 RepID=UPI00404A4F2D